MAARGDTMKSDDDLRREVEQQLEAEPSIDARRIVVSVSDGIVTLGGEVRSYAEKWQAERTVERVPAVRGLANEIEVHSDAAHTDSEMARMAIESLKWNVLVPSSSVTVRVENGWVFLTGEVSWDFQRRAAERALRNLPGIRGITNLVSVKPRVGAGDVGSH
jgi:osmotically-inducible protein OsmY